MGRGRDRGHLLVVVFVAPACIVSRAAPREPDEAGSDCQRRLLFVGLIRPGKPVTRARPATTRPKFDWWWPRGHDDESADHEGHADMGLPGKPVTRAPGYYPPKG